MSEQDDRSSDPPRNTVAQLLREALRRNLDIPHNREVVQEHMNRLLNGNDSDTPTGVADASTDTDTARRSDTNADTTRSSDANARDNAAIPISQTPASTHEAPTTPTAPTPDADPETAPGAAPTSAPETEPRRHHVRIHRELPVTLVSYSFGAQRLAPGTPTNNIWPLIFDMPTQSPEQRGRERERERERPVEGEAQPHRSRSQSPGGPTNRNRERSPMRSNNINTEAQTPTPVEPAQPTHIFLNQPTRWLDSRLIQRLVPQRTEEGGEAADNTTTPTATINNIQITTGGIEHRPDGATAATFTIPAHIFTMNGILGGGASRQKPRASNRVIRNLETLKLSEVQGQTCPICYDEFQEKPLGWDAIIAKLAEIERKKEEHGRDNTPAPASTDASEETSATAEVPEINPSTSIHGPVDAQLATASERAVQAEAEEMERARNNPDTEEDLVGALAIAANQRRYIVDTPEDATAFHEANPSEMAPIIRVDPHSIPRQPYVIPRVPEILRDAHEEVSLQRINRRALERRQLRNTMRQMSESEGAQAEAESEAEAEAEASFPESHVATKMPCGHIFGHSCICEWLRSNNSCPLCRTAVESEAEYLQATGQATEPRQGGFFEMLFSVLPRVFREIEEDRRRQSQQQPEQEGEAAATTSPGTGATDETANPTGATTTDPNIQREAQHAREEILRTLTNLMGPAQPTETPNPTEDGTNGTNAQANVHVHQPITGVYVYHRPSDFFRAHGAALGQAATTTPEATQGEEQNSDTHESNGADSGTTNNNGTASDADNNEGLRSRLVEPLRRIFRSSEDNRHHPYRRSDSEPGN